MKEKILASLKTKFTGVQDAALNRVAEKLSKTVTTEDQVQTAVDGVTFQSVLESYGDSRATEASNSAVQNYEKKHNLKDGKAVTAPPVNEPPKPDDDAPAWAKALLKQNEELAAKVANFEMKGVKDSLITRVQKNLADKKIPASFLKGRTIEIESEDQIDTVTKQLESDYADFKQELVNTGTVVDVPVNSVGSPASVDADIKEWAEKTNPKKE